MNGEKVQSLFIPKEKSDVVALLDLTKSVRPGENKIQLRQIPAGEISFQLAGVYWLANKTKEQNERRSAGDLDIRVIYDRSSLRVNEQLHCSVKAWNKSNQPINMAMVTLGVPPGFDLDMSSFEELKHSEQIEKFETTANEVILYLREISKEKPFGLNYTLQPKYPLRVEAPASSVYEYYDPQNRAESVSQLIEVTAN